MAMATKIIGVAGILLLVVSFLSWQKVCADLGPVGNFCAKASAWGGSGSFAGLIMGLLLIVLLIFEVVRLTNASAVSGLPVAPSKAAAYLGFGVTAFAIIKFLFAVTNDGTLFAWIGLILALAVGYGSWLNFQEPETPRAASAPPAPPA